MREKKNLYKVCESDSIYKAIDKNDALLRQLSKMDKEIKKLKSHNNTLKSAWKITEEYLVNISKEKSWKDISEEINNATFMKIKKICPNCKKKGMNKQQHNGFSTISCEKCNYRNKVNEKRSSDTEGS